MIDDAAAQKEYDSLVASVGCDTAADTLQCLREADYDELQRFMLGSPGIFQYTSLALVSPT